ncbi:MAG: nucleoside hydrolase [Bryobacteraceae bacterium]|nr:nucleoside hydrolase [Bryobacteraceae bacterium]
MLRRTLLGSLAALPFSLQGQASKRKILLDSDTANEIDDLYAITRALLEPGFQVLGLSSAQWNTRLSPPDTVAESQKLNTEILRLMGRQEIPAPMGSEMIMGKPWGGDEPRDSPAARLMIREARAMPSGAKLTIVNTGAVTNVASAIKLAPDIVPRIAVYLMGAHYFADRKVWNKDEFNVRNDLNATNFLLNAEGLELHVMPANVCGKLVFPQAETLRQLQGQGGIWDYLAARWLSFSPESEQWVMWDLALVEALARPGLAKEAQFRTPPENVQRDVFVYTDIDAAAMQSDWWRMAEAAQKR